MKKFELDKWFVKDLYGLYKSGRLDPQPEFQRSKVWNEKMKFDLIDTLTQNLPLGLIMINVVPHVDEDGASIERYQVVDGQQRVTTLFDYRDGVPSRFL